MFAQGPLAVLKFAPVVELMRPTVCHKRKRHESVLSSKLNSRRYCFVFAGIQDHDSIFQSCTINACV